MIVLSRLSKTNVTHDEPMNRVRQCKVGQSDARDCTSSMAQQDRDLALCHRKLSKGGRLETPTDCSGGDP